MSRLLTDEEVERQLQLDVELAHRIAQEAARPGATTKEGASR